MTRSAIVLSLICLLALPAYAEREASFVQPGAGAGRGMDTNEVISATPRTLNLGDTLVGITKRVQLYFTNYGTTEATISNISINADSNVRTDIASNDCVKVGKLKPNDQCSVGIEITPISGGSWSGEVTVVHDAAGRVSRAMLSGKTGGDVGNGTQPGLSLVGANKEQTIDFGEVAGGPVVRSVLLANDSASTLKIQKLELVAAGRDLTLLPEGGCAEGGEVAPGSSCPVTVVWQPSGAGDVSTDLIIRHTGPMGFAVIPVRGKATSGRSGGTAVARAPAPPVPVDAGDLGNDEALAAAAGLPVKKGKVPPITAAALFGREGDRAVAGDLVLRGTSGTQAILVSSDGSTIVVGEGESFTTSGGEHMRLLNVEPTKVTVTGDMGRTELKLQAPQSGGMKKNKSRGGDAGFSGSSDQNSVINKL